MVTEMMLFHSKRKLLGRYAECWWAGRDERSLDATPLPLPRKRALAFPRRQASQSTVE
jgi:hypothetical protein